MAECPMTEGALCMFTLPPPNADIRRRDRHVRYGPNDYLIALVVQILRYLASSGYLPTSFFRQSPNQSSATLWPSLRSSSMKSRQRLNLDEYRSLSAVFSVILIVRTVTRLWSFAKSL